MFNNITPLVRNLIIINVVVYILQQLLGNVMIEYLSLFDFRSPFFKPYQLFTYMWLHGGFMHILFNMLWLVFMGPVLERFLGDQKFLILYLVSGVGAGLLHVGVNYFEVADLDYRLLNIPTLGASGAVAGVMIAVAMLFPNTEILIYMVFPVKLKYFAIFYVVSELYQGLSMADTGIAHFAHLGGMLFGFALVKYWNVQRNNFY